MQNNAAEQIPLNLPHRPALAREDFLVGPANEDAINWIDRWPDWPAPALILNGAAASGKSHLAAVWAEKSGAVIIPAQNIQIFDHANKKPCVIDALDVWIGDKEIETTVFHLYNMFKEDERHMVITMRTPPSAIDFALPDLASRLRAAPVATIHPPDDDLLSSILIKLFHDRQVQVSADVIRYILPRMERSFDAARDLVERADHLALSRKSAVTVPLMRAVLAKQF
jgi:chromosomal replication initiation ATPase DnaA